MLAKVEMAKFDFTAVIANFCITRQIWTMRPVSFSTEAFFYCLTFLSPQSRNIRQCPIKIYQPGKDRSTQKIIKENAINFIFLCFASFSTPFSNRIGARWYSSSSSTILIRLVRWKKNKIILLHGHVKREAHRAIILYLAVYWLTGVSRTFFTTSPRDTSPSWGQRKVIEFVGVWLGFRFLHYTPHRTASVNLVTMQ